jgi:predicted small secreted protein
MEKLVAETVGVVMILSEKSLRVAACTFVLEACNTYTSSRAIIVHGNGKISRYLKI